MRVKRFRASSVNEALAEIKKELGEDAVILKTAKVPKQGVLSCMREEEIEVIAALESSSTISPNKTDEEVTDKDNTGTGNQNRKKLLKKKGLWAKKVEPGENNNSQKINEIQNYNNISRGSYWGDVTIAELEYRGELEVGPRSMTNELREWQDDTHLPPQLMRERNALTKNGVHPKLATRLLKQAIGSIGQDEPINAERIRERILFHITGLINTSGPLNCQAEGPKVVALVGPTGVGKTTTLAKLAVNGKFNYKKKVSLISADTYRMAALEHLTTFANIAQLPLSAVYSPREFKTAIQSQRDSDLILIDTAGRGQRDFEHISELSQFFESVESVEIDLVLPANMKSTDLLGVIKQFRTLSIDRLILTKIDETRTLGSLLNVISHSKYPLSYITFGQSVPEDIELANSQRLARMMLR